MKTAEVVKILEDNELTNVKKKYIFQYWEDAEGHKTWYYGPKINSMVGVKNYKIIKQEEEGVRRGRKTLKRIQALNRGEKSDEEWHRFADFLDEIESIKRIP